MPHWPGSPSGSSGLTSKGSTRAWRKVRAAVLVRDRYLCRWCGGPATTADHYPVPRKFGGPDELWNLVAACLPCNCRRAARMFAAPPSRNW